MSQGGDEAGTDEGAYKQNPQISVSKQPKAGGSRYPTGGTENLTPASVPAMSQASPQGGAEAITSTGGGSGNTWNPRLGTVPACPDPHPSCPPASLQSSGGVEDENAPDSSPKPAAAEGVKSDETVQAPLIGDTPGRATLAQGPEVAVNPPSDAAGNVVHGVTVS